MLLSLVSPKRKLVTNLEVERVTVPGHKGQLTVLPGHSPLVTTLSTGVMKFKDAASGQDHEYLVTWGYCEIGKEGITVLAETAEAKSEINIERAKKALKNSEEQLKDRSLGIKDIEKFRRKYIRAKARLDFASSESASRLH
jgi:F-type H+-transporting ATPase subunit epsilon